MTSLENDMMCLIESLEYMKDDVHQQAQALEHLSDMCLQKDGTKLFNKTKGLSVVFKLAFNKKTKPDILQKSLLCLGNASLTSDENKAIICSDQMLKSLQCLLVDKDQGVKIIASASYFLACLCTNNERIQNKARKSKCLDELIKLYRHFHPRGDLESSEVESWFEKANSNSPVILNHISHALQAAVNKPKNAENQLVCSRLLNLAVSSLLSSDQKQCKINSLQLIADCLYENEKTQRTFQMIGGIRYLSQSLQNETKNRDSMDVCSSLLDTVSVAVEDNGCCKNTAGDVGLINALIDFLQTDVSDTLILKCLMCLAELVHENDLCQQKLLQADGIPLIITIMSKKQDDMTAKIGTSILQSCVKNLSDLSKQESEPEEAAEETTIPTFSNRLQYFSGEKKKREEKLPTNQSKPMKKNILRTLELSDVSQIDSERTKELIKYIDIEDISNHNINKPSRRCQDISYEKKSKAAREEDEKHQIATKDKPQSDLIKLMQDQKELMRKFQDEISNLRAEVTSQASDYGGTRISRASASTPVEQTSVTVTSSRIPRPIFRSPRLVPVKRRALQQLEKASISVQNGTEDYCNDTVNGSVSYNNLHHDTEDRQPNLNHEEEAFRDKHHSRASAFAEADVVREEDNVTYFDRSARLIDNSSSVQDDERPALRRRVILSTICENSRRMQAEFQNNTLSCNAPKDNSRVPSVFEKVERWRQSVSKHANQIENPFKVPVITPLIKRRRNDKAKVQQLDPLRNKMTPEFPEIGDRYDESVEHAPKKTLLTKRRRPSSPDERYTDYTFTPEVLPNGWDRTKRSLNFESLLRNQEGEFDTGGNSHVRINGSVCGFTDDVPWTQTSTAHMKFNESKVKTSCSAVSVKIDCLGCQPFLKMPCINMNSRNLLSLIKKDCRLCCFHSVFAKKTSSFLDQFKNEIRLYRRRKRPYLSCFERSQRAQSAFHHGRNNQWESMSVFSFRSNDQPVPDNISDASGWTVNTAKRRRRQDYSEHEIENIIDGVGRYGTRWAAILNSYTFKKGRTSNDLRYKYKQMKKINCITSGSICSMQC